MQARTAPSGFTLVELMIVIAILGLIGVFATPFLSETLPNMRQRSAARDLFSAMTQAKVESIRRVDNVAISFNLVANTYTMFVDNGAGGGIAGNGTLDGTENLIGAATTLPNRVIFDPAFAGGGVSFIGNALVFTPRGIPVQAGAAANTFTPGPGAVRFCTVDSLGNPSATRRTIAVSSAGRIDID